MRNLNICKSLLMFLVALVAAVQVYGQQRDIRGQVVDEATGEPLLGVTVIVDGTARGVATDREGRFTIMADPDETLAFNYLGYNNLRLTASSIPPSGIIHMQQEMTDIEEVVVVGYGVQKKASVVASIMQTSGEELLKTGYVNSLSEALQGKLNGVTAINSSGLPGESSAEMYIRGKATWTSTSPLVVVDGIERNMEDIDINEIETLSVLKDASATAVYGVRGGNGVIMITTKRGGNTNAKISFTTNFGFKQPTTNMKWADHLTAMKAFNNAVINDNNWDSVIPQSTIDAWTNAHATGNYGPYNDVFPQVNWWDELAQTGFSQSYNVNIRGGTDFIRYFASVGYQHDGDIYDLEKQEYFNPNHSYDRYNWRSNLDFNLSKSTVLSINIAGKMGYQDKTFASSPYLRILTAPTNIFPVQYSDGQWGDIDYLNPVANMNQNGILQRKEFQGWYDVNLDQKLDFITKGLKVNAKLSYSSSSTTRSDIRNGGRLGNSNDAAYKSLVRYLRTYDYANPTVNADGSLSYPLLSETRLPDEETIGMPPSVSYDNLDGYTRKLYYEFGINYSRGFGDHNVSALALVNRQIQDNRNGGNNTIRFANYREDWVGRLTYNWKERYLTEFNISYTGSEKFERGNRFGLFPSVSVGWRASEENFIKKIAGDVLTNLKFRYSYGKTGYDGDWTANRWMYVQTYQSGGQVTFGDTSEVGFGPLYWEGTMANAYATWEESIKQNLGIEIGLWNKLNITVDLFDEKRDGILMTPKTIADWVSIGQSRANKGRTKNHGFEIELSWKDRIGQDFNYWANFGMSASENRVVFRDDPPDYAEYLKLAGKPIYSDDANTNRFLAIGNYGTIDDIFNAAQSNVNGWTSSQLVPGDLAYIDYNGDGVIDDNDKVPVSALNYPLFTYSLSFGFNWKGLGFSALLYAPTGVYKLVDRRYMWSFTNSQVMAQPHINDRWNPENPNTSGVVMPSLHVADQALNGSHNGSESTLRYQDHSYLRLKNVEISYDFPKRLIESWKIGSLQVYVKGTNLLTFWSGDKRMDPETRDAGTYPIVRTYTTGIRFSF